MQVACVSRGSFVCICLLLFVIDFQLFPNVNSLRGDSRRRWGHSCVSWASRVACAYACCFCILSRGRGEDKFRGSREWCEVPYGFLWVGMLSIPPPLREQAWSEYSASSSSLSPPDGPPPFFTSLPSGDVQAWVYGENQGSGGVSM